MNWENITILAAPCDECHTGGAHLEIFWGIIPSPLGEILVGLCSRGVRYLSFPDSEREQVIAHEWPAAKLTEDHAFIEDFTEKLFKQSTPPIQVIVKGTEMQLAVWNALLKIPAGELATYGDIATMIDRPTAVRAVGTAIGKNPVSYLIPCHRIIRKSGGLGGYRWGLDVKRRLIARESRDSANLEF